MNNTYLPGNTVQILIPTRFGEIAVPFTVLCVLTGHNSYLLFAQERICKGFYYPDRSMWLLSDPIDVYDLRVNDSECLYEAHDSVEDALLPVPVDNELSPQCTGCKELGTECSGVTLGQYCYHNVS